MAQEWFCQWFEATKRGEDPKRDDLNLSAEEPLSLAVAAGVSLESPCY